MRYLIIIFVMALISLPALAQSKVIDQVESDFAAMNEWQRQTKPIIDRLLEPLEPADRADILIDRFDAALISEAEALTQLDALTGETILIASDIREAIMDMPPVPFIETINHQSALTSETLIAILDTIEAASLNSIRIQKDHAKGIVQNVPEVFRSLFDTTEAVVKASNALVDAELTGISNQDHPQTTLSLCLKNSNFIALQMIKVQAGLYEVEGFSDLDVAIAELKDLRDRHADLIRDGKRFQNAILKGFASAMRTASTADKTFLRRAKAMMETYNDNWLFEQTLIDGINTLINTVEDPDSYIEDVEVSLDELSNTIILVEEKRAQISADRVNSFNQ